jgi:hypothetical protein
MHKVVHVVNDLFEGGVGNVLFDLAKNYIESDFSYEIVNSQFILNVVHCIFDNSTFSWWASYLNTRRKKVFIPNFLYVSR